MLIRILTVASCCMSCWLPLFAQVQDPPRTASLQALRKPHHLEKTQASDPALAPGAVVVLVYKSQPVSAPVLSMPSPPPVWHEPSSAATKSSVARVAPAPARVQSEPNDETRTADERVAPPSPSRRVKFEIKLEDETLYLALRRWAAGAGYQLVWHAGKDFPAYRTVYEQDDFEGAVERVMHDTETSSYPLHACVYPNKVMRVLHVAQSCERK